MDTQPGSWQDGILMDEEEGGKGHCLRWGEKGRAGMGRKRLGLRRENEERSSHYTKMNMAQKVLLSEQIICCYIIK